MDQTSAMILVDMYLINYRPVSVNCQIYFCFYVDFRGIKIILETRGK